MVGEVADPHRPGSGVPGQGVDDRLGAQLVAVDRVERVQPLRVPAGALDAAVDPAQAAPRPRRASPGRPAPGRSSRRRAASSSGSPSCGRRPAPRAATWSPRPGSRRSARGTARAGSARCAATSSRALAGQSQRRAPSPSTAARRPPAARRRLIGWRLQAVRAEPQLQHAVAAHRGQVDGGAGRVVAAVVDDRPSRRRGSTARPARWSRAPAARRRAAGAGPATWPNSGRGANSRLTLRVAGQPPDQGRVARDRRDSRPRRRSVRGRASR